MLRRVWTSKSLTLVGPRAAISVAQGRADRWSNPQRWSSPVHRHHSEREPRMHLSRTRRKVSRLPRRPSISTENTDAQGFVGASSIERIPIERAVRQTVEDFKNKHLRGRG